MKRVVSSIGLALVVGILFGLFFALIVSPLLRTLNHFTAIPLSFIEPLLFIIFLFEIVFRFAYLRALPPLRFIPTDPEACEFLDREQIDGYTIDLERLGFVRQSDRSWLFDRAFSRFLVHPEQYCFAEVVQFKTKPVFYTINAHLEQKWILNITTHKPTSGSYGLAYLPRYLVRYIASIEGSSPAVLFKSLLQWREQVMSDLKIDLVRDATLEYHLERQHKTRKKQRKALLKKSMISAHLKMLLFSFNPKTEWLGEYEKFQTKK